MNRRSSMFPSPCSRRKIASWGKSMRYAPPMSYAYRILGDLCALICGAYLACSATLLHFLAQEYARIFYTHNCPKICAALCACMQGVF
jgi:hypothetical protein